MAIVTFAPLAVQAKKVYFTVGGDMVYYRRGRVDGSRLHRRVGSVLYGPCVR